MYVTFLYYFFQSSTQTHCEVDNFAPSISAAIGSYLPQKYVWQTCICLHISPRFLFLYMYKLFYEDRIKNKTKNIQKLVNVALSVQFLELISLLGLTIVSSLENFDIHKVCFVSFGVCSLIYFSLTVYLWTHAGLNLETNEEINSLRIKKRVLKVYFILGLCMSYFYWWHNEYCTPYVYSFFCICEYVIVVANMYFHATARHDFAYVNLNLPSRPNYLPLHASA